MNFNMNAFLISLSTALDYAEQEILHITTNHSKRCAYIALRIAKELRLDDETCFDICSLALMHDNGITQAYLQQDLFIPTEKSLTRMEKLTQHCVIGEQNIANFPLLTDAENVILYHHEYLDGSGCYGKKGEEIPLLSQIISLADDIDMNSHLLTIEIEEVHAIQEFVERYRGKRYREDICDAFKTLSTRISFWRDLRDEHIVEALEEHLPQITIDIDPLEMLNVSAVFSNIIDAKSKFTATHSLDLMEKSEKLSNFLGWDQQKSLRFKIAANLHDIGKLAMPLDILEKPGALTKNEFEQIQEHALLTHTILAGIEGFEEIHKWASQHHERIDGSGYPHGLRESDLCKESQYLAALDMYQALTEDRPYRNAMRHIDAIALMEIHADKGLFTADIIQVLDQIFDDGDTLEQIS